MNRFISSTTRTTAIEREFIYTPADFKEISRLIYERAGISLAPAKMEMVYNRLSRRLRIHGFCSFAQYIEFLAKADGKEWSAFIGALTTHMTSFFREQHHFPILSAHLTSRFKHGRIQLWSAAASTGEEPYSMAITAAETFDTLYPPVSILATDVDSQVLAEAEEGIYPMTKISLLSEKILKRYFEWGSGQNSGSVRIRPELRQLVTFQQLNLLDPVWPMQRPFDAIFCRNVMIYFDRSTQKEVLDRSRRYLKQDGLYFAGHSENLSFAEELFRPCGKTVYRQHPLQDEYQLGVAV
jgi:chemotaxis protein methyltransferase CheR